MKLQLKKPVKILLIIAGSIFGLFLMIAILISPIAHHYLEKHSKELCNRVVTMDKLRVNLFNGSVTIQGFKALEENDQDVFLTFDKLRVNMSLWRLIGKTVKFTEITLINPNVAVLQNGNRFNFSDIIDFYKSDEPKKKDKEPSKWVVDLCNITLQKGNVVYRDLAINSRFHLKELALAIPRIYFSSQDTDIGLNLKFDDGGDLTLKLLYAIEKNAYHLNIKLNQFSVAAASPYIKQFLNIGEIGGRLSTNLNIAGNLDHILNIVADGNVLFQNLYVTDPKTKETFSKIGKLDINIDKIDIKENIYHFSKVQTTDANFTYEITNEGNAISRMLALDDKIDTTDVDAKTEKDSTTKISENPIDFTINELSINNSTFSYNDYTLRDTVRIPVTQVFSEIKNFRLNGPVTATLSAIVGESGQLKATWDGNFSDIENQKFGVFLQNFKLKTISPYSVHYFAHPISDGVMSFADNSTIVNNQITSENKVDIYNCVVEKKIKGAEREFNIPLRAAVYVLSDRKGQITFDLPVKGDLTAPEFSYKKIIFKTFCNLIVKIAAAPIDLIAKSLNKEPDIFADILYDIHPEGLGSESDDQLNKITEVLKEKSELILEVQQSINLEENQKEYALFSAKMDYCRQSGTANGPALFNAAAAIKNSDAKFQKYVDNQIENSSSYNDLSEKCLSLYSLETINSHVNENIERRNKHIISVFTTQGIDASRIHIMPLGNKVPPKGKTMVSFNIQVTDE